MNNFTIFEFKRSGAFPSRPLFTPCGANDVQSIGFNRDGHVVIERKSVPSDLVKRKVEERCAALEKERGRAPGRKERKEIKEEVMLALLATAFPKRKTVMLEWLEADGLLLVGSTSSADTDAIATLLVANEEGLELRAVQTQRDVADALTEWVGGDVRPDAFDLGRTVTMRDPMDGSSVSFKDYDLERTEVQDRATTGFLVTSVGLVYTERAASFTLTDDLQVKNFSLDDVSEGDIPLERLALVRALLATFGRVSHE